MYPTGSRPGVHMVQFFCQVFETRCHKSHLNWALAHASRFVGQITQAARPWLAIGGAWRGLSYVQGPTEGKEF